MEKTITLGKIPDIARALAELSALRLPFAKALGLARLQGAVRELEQVYARQIQALAQSFGVSVGADGTIPFPPDAGDKNELIAKLQALSSQEAGVRYDGAVGITAGDIGEQRLTTAAILALDSMVAFGE